MNSILNTIALAFKARKVVSGTDLIVDSIRKNNVKLVLVANDASKNVKKKLFDKSAFYQVQCIEFGDVDKLSKAIGKNNRVAIAICDEGFAKSIKEKIKEE